MLEIKTAMLSEVIFDIVNGRKFPGFCTCYSDDEQAYYFDDDFDFDYDSADDYPKILGDPARDGFRRDTGSTAPAAKGGDHASP